MIAISFVASAISSSSLDAHSPSPSKQKYSRPTQAIAGSGTISGDQLQILHPADLHLAVVDIDPVVGKQVLRANLERDGQAIAIFEARRRTQRDRKSTRLNSSHYS